MINLAKRFAKDESGATAIEYGLIAAGISVAIITVVNTLGSQLRPPSPTFPRSSAPPASKRSRRGERRGRAAGVLA